MLSAVLDEKGVRAMKSENLLRARHTRATGDNVILRPREDLFSEVDKSTGIELVSSASDITSVPDNIACCEIISVGELVTNVRVGQFCFIDFFWCKQGYILESDELYICGQESFCAAWEPMTQDIIPLDNYVVTRRALDRFKVAWFGTDRIEVPRMLLTDGIPGAKTSQGTRASTVLYEEVVRVGALTSRPRPGVMTRAEREFLDHALSDGFGYFLSEMEERLEVVRHERECGCTPDILPGELVVFCSDIAQRVRCKGEFWHIVPIDNVLASIDDAAILDEAIRRGAAGKLAV